MHFAISIHPDVPVNLRIVQLDVVRAGLVDGEHFVRVQLTNMVSSDTAFIFAAQVLAVERLEGESFLALSSEYRLHFEFLPSMWLIACPARDLIALISLEPFLVFNSEEGEPFGAEGSLETHAGTLPLSCQLGSKQAGKHHDAVLIRHTSADMRACLLEIKNFTGDTAIAICMYEFLSEGIVDDDAFILLDDELEPLQPFVTSFPRYDIVRIWAFASHLLTLVVHKSVEAPFVVVSSQVEALLVAYCCAFLVNLRVVHSEKFETFFYLEYVGTFCSFE